MAELARSFGRIASDYDVVRPECAPEAVDRAAEVLELGTDARVVLLPLLGDAYQLKITTVLYWGRRG